MLFTTEGVCKKCGQNSLLNITTGKCAFICFDEIEDLKKEVLMNDKTYSCCACGQHSKGSEWNARNTDKYGNGYMEIESPNKDDYSFVCPKCNAETEGWDIICIEEMKEQILERSSNLDPESEIAISKDEYNRLKEIERLATQLILVVQS